MTDFIMMLLESINNDITNLSVNSALTGSMGGFSSNLYRYITTIQIGRASCRERV